jgi:hypothetical protein
MWESIAEKKKLGAVKAGSHEASRAAGQVNKYE